LNCGTISSQWESVKFLSWKQGGGHEEAGLVQGGGDESGVERRLGWCKEVAIGAW